MCDNGKIVDYEIVTSSIGRDGDLLKDKVLAMVAYGWKPLGGAFLMRQADNWNTVYCQTMVKYEES